MGGPLTSSGLRCGKSVSKECSAPTAAASQVLVPKQREVVLLDVSQQDLPSPLQCLKDMLQASSSTLALPEHLVHLQRLEQQVPKTP